MGYLLMDIIVVCFGIVIHMQTVNVSINGIEADCHPKQCGPVGYFYDLHAVKRSGHKN